VLVAFQLPFADLRPFLAGAPTCVVPKRFVRRAGPRAFRARGGEEWPVEGRPWRAVRTLRYRGDVAQRQFGTSPLAVGLQGAFRRFFWADEIAPVARLELALSQRHVVRSGFLHRRVRMSDGDLLALVGAFAAMPVLVPRHGERALLEAAPLLTELLRESTTRFRAGPDGAAPDEPPPAWTFQLGAPLLLVEYGEHEGDPPPVPAIAVGERGGVLVGHYRHDAGETELRTWFLYATRRAGVDEVRRLRLHLFRLHSELEALRMTLRALGDDELARAFAPPSNPRGHAFDRYLERALGLPTRQRAYGFPMSPFLSNAYALERTATPAMKADLLDLLDRAEANRPILDSIEARSALMSVDDTGIWVLG